MTSSGMYGYAGKILRVDLSKRQISEEALDQAFLQKYLGGVGLGAYYLYREVPPAVKWSDPENRLILAIGPLNGLQMPGSGCFSVTTKGSLTEGAASSQANGFFGAYLKFCGYDGIVLKGKADGPVYLYVEEDKAELRDAASLKGKDTWETESLIKKELGKSRRELSVFGIGPAGENLARFACIVGDEGHVAGHNGIGAVMGSKNLKAVAVSRGHRKVQSQNSEKAAALVQTMVEKFAKTPPFAYGTSEGFPMLYPMGRLAIKNYTTTVFEERSKFQNGYPRTHFEIKRNPCYGCTSHHTHLMKVTEGPYAGFEGEEPEYEQWAAWSSLIGQTDPGAAVMLSNEGDRLGLDVNESGWMISWLMDCFDQGVLTRKDLDIDMTWGDPEAARKMLRKIAFREGVGDLLAEGVQRAAAKIDGKAQDMAIYFLKGNTPRTHDLRAGWWELFDSAVSNTGTIETHEGFPRAQLGLSPTYDNFSAQEISTLVAKTKGSMQFEDSLTICRLVHAGDHRLLSSIVSAVTGWDFTLEKGMEIGKRAVNLLKSYNIRNGITADKDMPSVRLGSIPPSGPAAGKSIMPYWKDMLRNYYTQMGWDAETGKPLPSTLTSLGLEFAIADIWDGKQ